MFYIQQQFGQFFELFWSLKNHFEVELKLRFIALWNTFLGVGARVYNICLFVKTNGLQICLYKKKKFSECVLISVCSQSVCVLVYLLLSVCLSVHAPLLVWQSASMSCLLLCLACFYVLSVSSCVFLSVSLLALSAICPSSSVCQDQTMFVFFGVVAWLLICACPVLKILCIWSNIIPSTGI